MSRRRRRRRRRDEGANHFRVVARVARVALVVLVSVAVGYAFYLALQWVAALAARRDSAAVVLALASAIPARGRTRRASA